MRIALALDILRGRDCACTAAPIRRLAPNHIPPARQGKAFSFEGPFGTYDRAALQRGFQVYKEVCSACHGLNLVAFPRAG